MKDKVDSDSKVFRAGIVTIHSTLLFYPTVSLSVRGRIEEFFYVKDSSLRERWNWEIHCDQ